MDMCGHPVARRHAERPRGSLFSEPKRYSTENWGGFEVGRSRSAAAQSPCRRAPITARITSLSGGSICFSSPGDRFNAGQKVTAHEKARQASRKWPIYRA
jgi:hypothetical protein